MSVTEFPKFGQPRIPDGTFVIFSFDPVAYATPLDDAVALEAAHRVERKTYLGLIEGVGTLDLPQLRLNFNIRVAGFAPPQEGEDDMYRTSPARCIPLFPATFHPDNRAPLKPSNTLPWPEGCYLHTLQLVNAFVSRVHHANPTNAMLTKEDMSRVGLHVAMDEHEASGGDDASDEASSEGSYYPSDEGIECASESSSVEQPFVKPIKVYIEIWEDLGVTNTLGEPKNVGRDIDEIVAIGAEWEKRKNYEYRAKAPQTSQWVEGVAESGHENPNDLPSNSPALNGLFHDELAPEDAVDERVQNGTIARDATPEVSAVQPNPPASPVADRLSSADRASTQESEGEEGSFGRKGPLKFVTARAHVLRTWFRQALHL